MGLIKEIKYLIFGIIILLVLLWWTRFQLVGTANYAYRLNRISGKIDLIDRGIILGEVRTKEDIEREYPQQVPEPAPAPNFEKKK